MNRTDTILLIEYCLDSAGYRPSSKKYASALRRGWVHESDPDDSSGWLDNKRAEVHVNGGGDIELRLPRSAKDTLLMCLDDYTVGEARISVSWVSLHFKTDSNA